MKSSALPPCILYICLFLAAFCYAVWPTVTLAADSGSANCGGGRSVTCSAYRCVCQDNVGCTGYDSSNRVVEDKPCPSDLMLLVE